MENLIFSHMKGIVELFSLKIHAKVILKCIPNDYSRYKMIKSTNRIGIYNRETNDAIGILGEIKTNNQKKEKRIYAFEINLSKLIKTISRKDHLKYTQKRYSKISEYNKRYFYKS